MELDKNSDRPFAVVTEASSGVGYELAKQFAEHGFDLVIVSENAGIVEVAQVCKNLGANVEAYIIDLSENSGVDRLIEKLDAIDRPIEAIAINAGIGNEFEIKLIDELKVIQLNITSSVHLAKHVLAEMVKRRRGRMLFTTSIQGLTPAPLQAVYGATKAFIHSYSDAIRNEVRDTGITVTAIMPGVTEGSKESPIEIAQQGFIAMMNGEGHVVVGSVKNKINVTVNKIKNEEGKAVSTRDYNESTKLKH